MEQSIIPNPYILNLPLKLKSLKNSHMPITTSKSIALIRTPEYQEWERSVKDYIFETLHTDLLFDKVYIHYHFRIWKDGIIDLGNLQSSIDDIMQACNIITNDEYRVLGHYFVSSEYCKESPGIELAIWHGDMQFKVASMITRLHHGLRDGCLCHDL